MKEKGPGRSRPQGGNEISTIVEFKKRTSKKKNRTRMKGVLNVEATRQWDKKEYLKLELERQDRERGVGNRREFQDGESNQGLKARDQAVDLGAKHGSVKLINTENEKVGWFCKYCNLNFTDSGSYLTHVNSKQHQKQLGLDMKVGKASLIQVVSKLRARINENQGISSDNSVILPPSEAFKEKVKKLEQEGVKRKENRKKRKRQREDDDAQHDAQVMEAMGFDSFGKNENKK